jgi:hypothetical protein
MISRSVPKQVAIPDSEFLGVLGRRAKFKEANFHVGRIQEFPREFLESKQPSESGEKFQSCTTTPAVIVVVVG